MSRTLIHLSWVKRCVIYALKWRHNEADVSNRQPFDCLLNRFFQAQIKENTKAPRYWPLCGGIHRWLVSSSHKGPVKRKMFSFDDVIMYIPQSVFLCESTLFTPFRPSVGRRIRVCSIISTILTALIWFSVCEWSLWRSCVAYDISYCSPLNMLIVN